jgi:hypothetical protein
MRAHARDCMGKGVCESVCESVGGCCFGFLRLACMVERMFICTFMLMLVMMMFLMMYMMMMFMIMLLLFRSIRA